MRQVPLTGRSLSKGEERIMTFCAGNRGRAYLAESVQDPHINDALCIIKGEGGGGPYSVENPPPTGEVHVHHQGEN